MFCGVKRSYCAFCLSVSVNWRRVLVTVIHSSSELVTDHFLALFVLHKLKNRKYIFVLSTLLLTHTLYKRQSGVINLWVQQPSFILYEFGCCCLLLVDIEFKYKVPSESYKYR